jgi:hypothetical protein
MSLVSRDRKQVQVVQATLEWIMNEPAFSIGVDDYRAGRPMRDLEEEGADTNAQWNYERGRQWAAIAPMTCRFGLRGSSAERPWRLHGYSMGT